MKETIDNMHEPDKENVTEVPATAVGRPLWRRLLKWTAVTVGIVVALFVLVCTLIVWILTPPRLTPMVGHYASEYLNADVKASRIELTFWHTFPELTVEVDSLSVVSRSLDGLPDSVKATLPAGVDSLLSIGSFRGGVNVAALLAARISLYDVVFNGLDANLVQVNDSVANYDIVPPSTEESDDESSFAVPYLSINRFAITDARSLRYRSLADSLDIAVGLHSVELAGEKAPVYALAFSGDVKMPLLSEFDFESLAFGATGSVVWERESPLSLAFKDFDIYADEFKTVVSSVVDFSEPLTVKSLRVAFEGWDVSHILPHLPADVRSLAAPLKTDMAVRGGLELVRPWVAADTLLPSVDFFVEVPACKMTYQALTIDRFATLISGHIDRQEAMNMSYVNVEKFLVDGEGVDIDLSVKATDIFSDPLLDGRFQGKVNFEGIPRGIRERIPGKVEGLLSGHSEFRFLLSDLTPQSFHRLNASGELRLNNLSVELDSLGAVYTHEALLRFGTNNSFVRDDVKVDSLLQLSLKVDTLSALADGIDLQVRDFLAGVGSVNRSSSSDTTSINPFGGRVSAGLLKINVPEDTLRLWAKDADIRGSLLRYKGDGKLPMVKLSASLGGLLMGQSLTKVAVGDAELDMTLHKRAPRRRQSATGRRAAATVSASVVSTDASPAPARSVRLSAVADSVAAGEDIDISLSGDEQRLLRNWDVEGTLRASAGRLVTPSFPLLNRLKNVDLTFSTDSVVLRDLYYSAGQSDFLINGTISNIRRALLSSRRDNTLGVDFSVVSDTINVNQIVRALFAGASVSHSTDSAMVWSEDEAAEERIREMADTAAPSPFLVPRNLRANLVMKADRVLYSDLELYGFHGNVMAYDGAVNLHDLAVSTDVGSIGLNGLYAAPTAEDLQFGLGMKVDRFRLDRLSDLVPAIDSLMPLLKDFAGIVNADIAVTTRLEPNMDIDIPSLKAAVKIEGDSLVLLDADTFKSLSKWLMFKNKKRNLIDHMAVEAVIDDSRLELYPFMFNIDRYQLGVMGSNDLAMNMDYHISVLKSPIPFKFGINIKGTPDNMKIRLGGAKYKDNMAIERREIADSTRINLVEQINNVFRRGVTKARQGRLNFRPRSGATGVSANVPAMPSLVDGGDGLTAADSLRFIREGLIENPDTLRFPVGQRQ